MIALAQELPHGGSVVLSSDEDKATLLVRYQPPLHNTKHKTLCLTFFSVDLWLRTPSPFPARR